MLKLTRKTDYGLIAMRHLAEHAHQGSCSATDLADACHLPLEVLAKILQRLARAELVVPQRGINGGYTLAREAGGITALQVIQAIEGPLFLTSCVTVHGRCDRSSGCTVREPLQRVSRGIEEVLSGITIAELAQPTPASQERACWEPRRSEAEAPELSAIATMETKS